MLIVRWAVLLMLLGSAVSFAFYAGTGQVRFRTFGLTLLKWTLAAIAGGGIAGIVQGATVLTRGGSSAGTGGLANPVLATAELGGSLITSILSLVMPVLVALVIGGLLIFAAWRVFQRRVRPPSKV